MPSGSKIVFLRRNVFTIYLNATLSIEFIARTLGTTGRQSLLESSSTTVPKRCRICADMAALRTNHSIARGLDRSGIR